MERLLRRPKVKPIHKDELIDGEFFVIKGVQLKDIDGNLSEMLDMSLKNKNSTADQIYKIDIRSWKRLRQKISDLIVDIFKQAGCITLFKEVETFKIQYVGKKGDYYI